MTKPGRSGVGAGFTLSRYLLGLLARPFFAALAVVLPALLMERLLRLFDLVASQGVPAAAVVRMLADLVPHYLGLALPAALFAGVYFVVARLSASQELDAMQSAGVSLGWISRPFLLTGLAAALLGYGLYGYLQPYARYAYRAAFQAATQGVWDATIQAGEMTHVSRNLVFTADAADQARGTLGGITIYEREADGTEKITTARTGQLTLSADRKQLLLVLQAARQIGVQADGRVERASSSTATSLHPFIVPLKGFRPRGIDEREMTLGELRSARREADRLAQPARRRRLDGELHGRLVRTLSLALLPLLAVPFGLTARRTRRQYGVAVGIVLLVLYYHAIQLAQSIGAAGFADPRAPLWIAFLLFLALCLSAFYLAERRSSESPFDAVFALPEQVATGLGRLWHQRRARSA